MNKKFYLLVLGAASLALQPVNARSQFAKKQVAKVVNTDVATSVTSSSSSSSTTTSYERNIISVIKPADMPVVSFGSKKEDQLLGCDVVYNSDSLNVLPTRIFDEKGRLIYVKSPDGSYERYVYAEDQQGRTISEDKYEHTTSDEAGKETLLCSKTYGYDHLVGDVIDGKAYLMKEITYGVDHFSQIHYISEIKEYNWFEAGNCFVLTGQKNNIKVTVEISGDVCEATAWKGEELKDGWGNWSKIKGQVWNVTDNSTIHKDYSSFSVSGNKKEVTSANGYTTIINYNYSADKGGSWIPTDKTVKTDNYDDPWIYDGKNREKNTYNYDGTKFVLKTKEVSEWVHQNINVVHDFEYDYNNNNGNKTDYGYRAFKANGEEISRDSIYFFNDWSYVLKNEPEAENEEEGRIEESYSRILVFYDKNGQENAKYRMNGLKASNRPTEPLEIFKNGKWERVSIPNGTYTLALGDFGNQLTYTFNSEGYIAKEEQSIIEEKLDPGVEMINWKTRTYSYSDNGYKIDIQYPEDKYPNTYDTMEITLEADGTHTSIEKCYLRGDFEFAKKYVTTTYGVLLEYRWDWKANDFETEPQVWNIGVTSESNGVKTTIYKEMQDGKIVETSKREEINNGNGSTTITYNKVGDEWQPSSKEENSHVAKPQFALIMPSSPVKAYNSSAYISDIDSTFFADKSDLSSHANYTWDASTDSWKTEYADESACNVEGNTLTYTVKNSYIESVMSYTRDNDNRLVQYTENSSTATRAAANTSLIKDFEYDKKGRLASVTITTDHVEKYVMKYGDEATGINPVVAVPVSAIHISVSGKMITAEGCKQLALYSLDGKKLAASQNATIMAPTTGVFIIVADGKKIKMVIR
mgnify:FL=1